MPKSFLLAEVKAVKAPDETSGAFEAILSAPTLDRDGEVIAKGAFEPLPDSIPVHAYHDFSDPVGRAQPFYEGDVLKVRGFYASTPRAQEIRTLVSEGVIGSMSVGFMAAERQDDDDGIPTIRTAEILEGSFVSVPSNREAAVLVAKQYAADAKVGARNSAADQERIQNTHDHMVELGAECAAKAANPEQQKSTDDEPEGAAPAANPPADVVVAQARALAAQATAALAL